MTAMTPLLLPIDIAGTEPIAIEIARERVIDGAPTAMAWVMDRQAGGSLTSGIWEATPGTWRVAYDKWEFWTVLSGVSILTEDGGEPRTVRAGDAFIIRPGFAGLWQVVETTRKIFVIHRT